MAIKILGSIFILIGLAMMFGGCVMEKTVEGQYNIGLLAESLRDVLSGGIFFLAGIAVLGLADIIPLLEEFRRDRGREGSSPFQQKTIATPSKIVMPPTPVAEPKKPKPPENLTIKEGQCTARQVRSLTGDALECFLNDIGQGTK